jgi:hypothetical protein
MNETETEVFLRLLVDAFEITGKDFNISVKPFPIIKFVENLIEKQHMCQKCGCNPICICHDREDGCEKCPGVKCN